MNLKERRKKVGITQQELADAVGCSRVWICLIEKGRKIPSEGVLEKIENELKRDGMEAEPEPEKPIYSLGGRFSKAIAAYRTELLNSGCALCHGPIETDSAPEWDYWRCTDPECDMSVDQEIGVTWCKYFRSKNLRV